MSEKQAAQKKPQDYTGSLRLANESIQIARATVGKLSEQTEQLSAAETKLDNGQFMVSQSKYLVRGMTWSGWMSNMMTSAPQPAVPGTTENGQVPAGFICPECKQTFRNSNLLLTHYSTTHPVMDATTQREENTETVVERKLKSVDSTRSKSKSTTSSSQLQYMDTGYSMEQSAYLDALAPQLAEMKQMGMAMGHALDGHNKQLERISQKTEETNDEMRLVTVKAARLARGSPKLFFQYRIAFQETSSGMFLQSHGGTCVVNQLYISESTIFRAYTVGDESHDVWGFQHEQSGYYMGLNRYGALRVQGRALKSYEQFGISPIRSTPLYSFSSNFGYGGWTWMDENKALFCVRGTPVNKQKAVRFDVVKIDEESELCPENGPVGKQHSNIDTII